MLVCWEPGSRANTLNGPVLSKLPDPRTIIVALVIVSTTIYSAYSPWFVCALGGFAAVMLASATINPNTLVRPSWVAVYLATFAALGTLVFVIPCLLYTSDAADDSPPV